MNEASQNYWSEFGPFLDWLVGRTLLIKKGQIYPHHGDVAKDQPFKTMSLTYTQIFTAKICLVLQVRWGKSSPKWPEVYADL